MRLKNAVIPRLLLEESHMTYCRVNPQTSGNEIDFESTSRWCQPMIGENWQLVTDEPVEFEK